MKKATKSTMQKFYNQFKRSENTILTHCYTNYSQAKERAFDYCKRKGFEWYADRERIISHNCNVFTYAFTGLHPETGECVFVVITRDYDRWIPLAELD